MKNIHDFQDFVDLVDDSGVRAKVLSPEEFFNFEDGISRSKLGLLTQEGLRPHLREVRQLQVRRGSEKIYMKTSHKQTSWRGYDLLKANYHPTESPKPRKTPRGINKDKIDVICRCLTSLMPSHKAIFWQRLQNEASRAGVRDLMTT